MSEKQNKYSDSPEFITEFSSPSRERLLVLLNLKELRLRTLTQMQQPITDRILSNPVPSAEEFSAGSYKEQIEPQCRNAIFAIRRKGYRTASSGFAGIYLEDNTLWSGAAQTVEGGLYELSSETKTMLETEGYHMSYGSIGFYPKTADIIDITNQWDHLAEILPDLGQPAEANLNDTSEFYRLAQANTPWVDWAQITLPAE